MLQHNTIHCPCRLGKQRKLSGRVFLSYLGRSAERHVVVVVEPLVTEDISGAEPPLGTLHQKPLDEILGLR